MEATARLETDRRLLALLRNAHACADIEELQRLLVKDLQLLVACDHIGLVLHMGERSILSALGSAAQGSETAWLEKLPKALGMHHKIVVITAQGICSGVDAEPAQDLARLLEGHQAHAVVAVPLVHRGECLGSLLLVFEQQAPPGTDGLEPLAQIAPVLAGVLSHALLRRDSRGAQQVPAREASALQEGHETIGFWRRPRNRWLLLLALLVVLLLPVPFRVGGNAELAPKRQHQTYVEVTGTVARVLVHEGEMVKKGDILARLDDRELAFQIRTAARQVDRLEAEVEILRNLAAANSEQQGELELIRLQKDRVAEELAHLRFQREKLTLRATTTGLVVTERVERLVGRRFAAGEVFCRIAPVEELDLVLRVPDEDIGYVHKKMPMHVVFAARPGAPVAMEVEEIAPMATADVEHGNNFKVRARFVGELGELRPGMGGTGYVAVGWRPLGYVLFRRLLLRLRRALLFL